MFFDAVLFAENDRCTRFCWCTHNIVKTDPCFVIIVLRIAEHNNKYSLLYTFASFVINGDIDVVANTEFTVFESTTVYFVSTFMQKNRTQLFLRPNILMIVADFTKLEALLVP
jgi:hypothetical protein